MADLMVYVTAPNEAVAWQLGRAMVEARLAACANVLGAIKSCYWWEGTIYEDAEAVLLLKTTTARFEALRERLVAAHPYEVPCVVAWPIERGHLPYVQWLRDQVTPE